MSFSARRRSAAIVVEVVEHALEALARLVDQIQKGALRPVVRAVYPLADIALAQSDFLGKAQTGKIVLVP